MSETKPYKEMTEEEKRKIEELAGLVLRAVENLAKTLSSIGLKFLKTWNRILRTEYEARGCPYGPSDEDMMRYWNEKFGVKDPEEMSR